MLFFVLTSLALAQSPVAEPAPQIGIVTMTPGSEYWARFGHNAIVVDDPSSGVRLSYNYGYFDFDQPGFLARFLRGQMRYRLVLMRLEDDLRGYASDGRGASVQWLDLRPEQAHALSDFLAWNALPENAEYRYDYFTDNCSTRVRDALDRALDGALSRQMSGRSHGLTYRVESLRLGADVPWLLLGMHAGLGPAADRPLSIWDEAFVPQRLADALDRATNSDGQPLVRARQNLLPDRLALERATASNLRWPFALTGLGAALFLAWSLRERAGRLQRLGGALLAGGLLALCGLGGMCLIALWALTEHVAAYGNENLLLFNPLCLLLLGALPALARGTTPHPWLRHLGMIVATCAVFALFLRFLPFRIQNNGDFIVLLGPIHVALAWRMSRQARTPWQPRN
ncbi:DUF4105 domain-containing protein [Xanthomonadaceae bacterium JHOS43]|nr:DUF4105 domain-containing protein [Xanthomonadaceae bacterium JHOS43]